MFNPVEPFFQSLAKDTGFPLDQVSSKAIRTRIVYSLVAKEATYLPLYVPYSAYVSAFVYVCVCICAHVGLRAS